MDGYGPQDVPTFATGTISVLSLLGNDTVGAAGAAGAFGASSAMARAECDGFDGIQMKNRDGTIGKLQNACLIMFVFTFFPVKTTNYYRLNLIFRTIRKD